MKFKDAAKSRLKVIEITGSETTFTVSKGYLKRCSAFLGHMECEDITRNTILDLIIHRKEINPTISNATINKYIKHVLMTLREEVGINLQFKLLRETKKLPPILTPNTISRVFAYLDSLNSDEGLRNRVMFMLLENTGMRISELLRVKVSDFDFEKRTIFIAESKNGYQRYVLYKNSTVPYLEKYIVSCKIRKHIFINLETNTVLHPDSIQTICQRIQEKAEIEQSITPHKWRHTFATNFNAVNGNTFVLMKLLGHKSIKTTQRYTQVSLDTIIEEYAKIDQ